MTSNRRASERVLELLALLRRATRGKPRGASRGTRRRPAVDLLERRCLLATLTVNSADDNVDLDGVLTLREAIEVVNRQRPIESLSPLESGQVDGPLSDGDTIAFAIPGPGPHTIRPVTPLPAIVRSVTIDGYSQPGSASNSLVQGDNAHLLVELDGSLAGAFAPGLTLQAGSSTVQGLVINRFEGEGIFVTGDGLVRLRGNFIGADPTGTVDLGNRVGVLVWGATGFLLGGSAPADRNVISANTQANVTAFAAPGKTLTDVVVQGNFIGTDASGTRRLKGPTNEAESGVGVGDARNVLIGDLNPSERNIISGNNGDGVSVIAWGGPGSYRIQGNFIGTDITGTKAVGNSGTGVFLNDSSDVQLGGSESTAGNIISANFTGVVVVSYGITDGANVIRRNRIGTGEAGTEDLGNMFQGVVVQGTFTNGNTFGGSVGEANLISHNSNGVFLALGASGTQILSNQIYANDGGPGISAFGAAREADVTLSASTRNGARTVVTGGMTGVPDARYVIQFFGNETLDKPGVAEGQAFLGATEVTTGPDGRAAFVEELAVTLDPGRWVTATATRPGGNTTPFSNPVLTRLNRPSSVVLDVSPAGATTVDRGVVLVTTVSGAGEERPSGTVTLLVDGAPRAPVPLVPAGGSSHADITVAPLGPGVHTFSASYSGDTIYAPVETCPARSVTALARTRTSVSATANPATVARPVTLTAVVTPVDTGFGSFSGLVTFVENGRVLGSAPVDAAGRAALVPAGLPAGNHPISAVYRGGGLLAGSTSAPTIVTVDPAPVIPPPPAPVVLGAYRSRRHRRPVVVLVFSSPMDPASVGDYRNYWFATLRRSPHNYAPVGPSVGTRSAAYDPLTRSVALRPARLLGTRRTYLITLNLRGPSGLRDVSGAPLAGDTLLLLPAHAMAPQREGQGSVESRASRWRWSPS